MVGGFAGSALIGEEFRRLGVGKYGTLPRLALSEFIVVREGEDGVAGLVGEPSSAAPRREIDARDEGDEGVEEERGFDRNIEVADLVGDDVSPGNAF